MTLPLRVSAPNAAPAMDSPAPSAEVATEASDTNVKASVVSKEEEDLGKRLLNAAKLGDDDQLRELLSSGAPFTADWLGVSALHVACQLGHVTSAEILLRAGLSRDVKSKVDRTPLHLAAQAGQLGVVELLLRCGAAVDPLDLLKMTPLHWASENGHVGVCRMLLNKGADPIAESKFARTPMDHAKDRGFAQIVNLLKLKSEGTKCKREAKDNLKATTESSLKNSPITYQKRKAKSAVIGSRVPVAKGIQLQGLKTAGISPRIIELNSGACHKPVIVTSNLESNPSKRLDHIYVTTTPSLPTAIQDDPTPFPEAALPTSTAASTTKTTETNKEDVPSTEQTTSTADGDEASSAPPRSLTPNLLRLLHSQRGLSACWPGDPLDEFQSQGPILTLLEDDLPPNFLQGQTLALTKAGRLAMEKASPDDDTSNDEQQERELKEAQQQQQRQGQQPSHEISLEQNFVHSLTTDPGVASVASLPSCLPTSPVGECQCPNADSHILVEGNHDSSHSGNVDANMSASLDGSASNVTVIAIDENGLEKPVSIGVDELLRLQQEGALNQGLPITVAVAPN